MYRTVDVHRCARPHFGIFSVRRGRYSVFLSKTDADVDDVNLSKIHFILDVDQII